MEKKTNTLPSEDILQYVWKTQSFQFLDLHTTSVEVCTIDTPGFLNKHAGPDFFEGRITIGHTQWVGPIEIHVRSSDWRRHNHQNDPAYNSVILHVVYVDDEPLRDKFGVLVPTIVLKNRIPFRLLKNHKTLLNQGNKLACSSYLAQTPQIVLFSWRERMMIEKFEHKSNLILKQFKKHKQDWEFVTLCLLSRSFGFHYNSLPMQELIQKIDQTILQKILHDEELTMSYLFGMANLLPQKPEDNFEKKMVDHFKFLTYKFRLTKQAPMSWNFARIRPQNYPTIRLAQFATVLHKNKRLFRKIVEGKTIHDLHDILSIPNHSYWTDHYTFQNVSKSPGYRLTKSIKNSIVINAFLPLVYSYGKFLGKNILIEQAMSILENIPFEKNAITKLWTTNQSKQTALDSQSMHHCYTNYCIKKKCTDCSIGHHILQQMNYMVEEDDAINYHPAQFI